MWNVKQTISPSKNLAKAFLIHILWYIFQSLHLINRQFKLCHTYWNHLTSSSLGLMTWLQYWHSISLCSQHCWWLSWRRLSNVCWHSGNRHSISTNSHSLFTWCLKKGINVLKYNKYLLKVFLEKLKWNKNHKNLDHRYIIGTISKQACFVISTLVSFSPIRSEIRRNSEEVNPITDDYQYIFKCYFIFLTPIRLCENTMLLNCCENTLLIIREIQCFEKARKWIPLNTGMPSKKYF